MIGQSHLCLTNTTIITPGTTILKGSVVIQGRQIESVSPADQLTILDDVQILDGQGLILAPGFIDLQVNGAFGDDLTHDPSKLWQIGAGLVRYGVTSYLPTVITSPLKNIRLALSTWLEGPPVDYAGSIPLGWHVEGPYLNPEKKGAHNPAYLRNPSLKEVISWSPEMGVRLVTLAPELPGALDLIAALAERGVVVGAGHSMATLSQAKQGIRAGIRYATHLFNAMPALHHREPALIGAVLADERVTIGLIPDGLHIHPSLVKVIWRVAGDGRLNLVTDAMAALGMADGAYSLGSLDVQVTGNRAVLEDGTLAGSILSMDQALRNLLEFTGCSPAEALQTITTTPATLLGLSRQKGQIAPGFDADLVLLTPDFEVHTTIVSGQVVYQANG
jgi:N-acetylglucosamine-6-phosphate deacetylase